MSDHTYSHRIAEEIKLTRRSGRGIRRLVTLCGTVTQLVAEYDRRLLESESDDEDGDRNEDTPLQNKEEVRRSGLPMFTTSRQFLFLTV